MNSKRRPKLGYRLVAWVLALLMMMPASELTVLAAPARGQAQDMSTLSAYDAAGEKTYAPASEDPAPGDTDPAEDPEEGDDDPENVTPGSGSVEPGTGNVEPGTGEGETDPEEGDTEDGKEDEPVAEPSAKPSAEPTEEPGEKETSGRELKDGETLIVVDGIEIILDAQGMPVPMEDGEELKNFEVYLTKEDPFTDGAVSNSTLVATFDEYREVFTYLDAIQNPLANFMIVVNAENASLAAKTINGKEVFALPSNIGSIRFMKEEHLANATVSAGSNATSVTLTGNLLFSDFDSVDLSAVSLNLKGKIFQVDNGDVAVKAVSGNRAEGELFFVHKGSVIVDGAISNLNTFQVDEESGDHQSVRVKGAISNVNTIAMNYQKIWVDKTITGIGDLYLTGSVLAYNTTGTAETVALNVKNVTLEDSQIGYCEPTGGEVDAPAGQPAFTSINISGDLIMRSSAVAGIPMINESAVTDSAFAEDYYESSSIRTAGKLTINNITDLTNHSYLLAQPGKIVINGTVSSASDATDDIGEPSKKKTAVTIALVKYNNATKRFHLLTEEEVKGTASNKAPVVASAPKVASAWIKCAAPNGSNAQQSIKILKTGSFFWAPANTLEPQSQGLFSLYQIPEGKIPAEAQLVDNYASMKDALAQIGTLNDAKSSYWIQVNDTSVWSGNVGEVTPGVDIFDPDKLAMPAKAAKLTISGHNPITNDGTALTSDEMSQLVAEVSADEIPENGFTAQDALIVGTVDEEGDLTEIDLEAMDEELLLELTEADEELIAEGVLPADASSAEAEISEDGVPLTVKYLNLNNQLALACPTEIRDLTLNPGTVAKNKQGKITAYNQTAMVITGGFDLTLTNVKFASSDPTKQIASITGNGKNTFETDCDLVVNTTIKNLNVLRLSGGKTAQQTVIVNGTGSDSITGVNTLELGREASGDVTNGAVALYAPKNLTVKDVINNNSADVVYTTATVTLTNGEVTKVAGPKFTINGTMSTPLGVVEEGDEEEGEENAYALQIGLYPVNTTFGRNVVEGTFGDVTSTQDPVLFYDTDKDPMAFLASDAGGVQLVKCANVPAEMFALASEQGSGKDPAENTAWTSKNGGFVVLYDDGTDGEAVVVVYQNEKNRTVAVSFPTWNQAIAEINALKKKRDYTIVLNGDVLDPAKSMSAYDGTTASALNFPGAANVATLTIIGQGNEIWFNNTGLTLTSNTMLKDVTLRPVNTAKVNNVTGVYDRIDPDVFTPSITTITAKGYTLTIGANVRVENQVGFEGGGTGNLIFEEVDEGEEFAGVYLWTEYDTATKKYTYTPNDTVGMGGHIKGFAKVELNYDLMIDNAFNATYGVTGGCIEATNVVKYGNLNVEKYMKVTNLYDYSYTADNTVGLPRETIADAKTLETNGIEVVPDGYMTVTNLYLYNGGKYEVNGALTVSGDMNLNDGEYTAPGMSPIGGQKTDITAYTMSLKNVTMNQTRLHAFRDMTITGTLVSNGADNELVTHRKADASGKASQPYLAVNGTVVNNDTDNVGDPTIKVGVYPYVPNRSTESVGKTAYVTESWIDAGAAVSDESDAVELNGYSTNVNEGVLLNAKTAPAASFSVSDANIAADTTGKVAVADDLVLYKNGTQIAVYAQDLVQVGVEKASGDMLGYYPDWAKAVAAINAEKNNNEEYVIRIYHDLGELDAQGVPRADESVASTATMVPVNMTMPTYGAKITICSGYTREELAPEGTPIRKKVLFTNNLAINRPTEIKDLTMLPVGTKTIKGTIGTKVNQNLTAYQGRAFSINMNKAGLILGGFYSSERLEIPENYEYRTADLQPVVLSGMKLTGISSAKGSGIGAQDLELRAVYIDEGSSTEDHLNVNGAMTVYGELKTGDTQVKVKTDLSAARMSVDLNGLVQTGGKLTISDRLQVSQSASVVSGNTLTAKDVHMEEGANSNIEVQKGDLVVSTDMRLDKGSDLVVTAGSLKVTGDVDIALDSTVSVARDVTARKFMAGVAPDYGKNVQVSVGGNMTVKEDLVIGGYNANKALAGKVTVQGNVTTKNLYFDESAGSLNVKQNLTVSELLFMQNEAVVSAERVITLKNVDVNEASMAQIRTYRVDGKTNQLTINGSVTGAYTNALDGLTDYAYKLHIVVGEMETQKVGKTTVYVVKADYQQPMDLSDWVVSADDMTNFKYAFAEKNKVATFKGNGVDAVTIDAIQDICTRGEDIAANTKNYRALKNGTFLYVVDLDSYGSAGLGNVELLRSTGSGDILSRTAYIDFAQAVADINSINDPDAEYMILLNGDIVDPNMTGDNAPVSALPMPGQNKYSVLEIISEDGDNPCTIYASGIGAMYGNVHFSDVVLRGVSVNTTTKKCTYPDLNLSIGKNTKGSMPGASLTLYNVWANKDAASYTDPYGNSLTDVHFGTIGKITGVKDVAEFAVDNENLPGITEHLEIAGDISNFATVNLLNISGASFTGGAAADIATMLTSSTVVRGKVTSNIGTLMTCGQNLFMNDVTVKNMTLSNEPITGTTTAFMGNTTVSGILTAEAATDHMIVRANDKTGIGQLTLNGTMSEGSAALDVHMVRFDNQTMTATNVPAVVGDKFVKAQNIVPSAFSYHSGNVLTAADGAFVDAADLVYQKDPSGYVSALDKSNCFVEVISDNGTVDPSDDVTFYVDNYQLAVKQIDGLNNANASYTINLLKPEESTTNTIFYVNNNDVWYYSLAEVHGNALKQAALTTPSKAKKVTITADPNPTVDGVGTVDAYTFYTGTFTPKCNVEFNNILLNNVSVNEKTKTIADAQRGIPITLDKKFDYTITFTNAYTVYALKMEGASYDIQKSAVGFAAVNAPSASIVINSGLEGGYVSTGKSANQTASSFTVKDLTINKVADKECYATFDGPVTITNLNLADGQSVIGYQAMNIGAVHNPSGKVHISGEKAMNIGNITTDGTVILHTIRTADKFETQLNLTGTVTGSGKVKIAAYGPSMYLQYNYDLNDYTPKDSFSADKSLGLDRFMVHPSAFRDVFSLAKIKSADVSKLDYILAETSGSDVFTSLIPGQHLTIHNGGLYLTNAAPVVKVVTEDYSFESEFYSLEQAFKAIDSRADKNAVYNVSLLSDIGADPNQGGTDTPIAWPAMPAQAKKVIISGANSNPMIPDMYSIYFTGNMTLKCETVFENVGLNGMAKDKSGRFNPVAFTIAAGNFNLAEHNVFCVWDATYTGTAQGKITGTKNGTFDYASDIDVDYDTTGIRPVSFAGISGFGNVKISWKPDDVPVTHAYQEAETPTDVQLKKGKTWNLVEGSGIDNISGEVWIKIDNTPEYYHNTIEVDHFCYPIISKINIPGNLHIEGFAPLYTLQDVTVKDLLIDGGAGSAQEWSTGLVVNNGQGNLKVNGNAEIGGIVNKFKNLTVSKNLTIKGEEYNRTLVYYTGDITVSGTTFLDCILFNMNGNCNMTLKGNAVMDPGTYAVGKNFVAEKDLTVNGCTLVTDNGNVTVKGSLTMNDGNIEAAGNMEVTKDLSTTTSGAPGNSVFGNNIKVGGTSTLEKTLLCAGVTEQIGNGAITLKDVILKDDYNEVIAKQNKSGVSQLTINGAVKSEVAGANRLMVLLTLNRSKNAPSDSSGSIAVYANDGVKLMTGKLVSTGMLTLDPVMKGSNDKIYKKGNDILYGKKSGTASDQCEAAMTIITADGFEEAQFETLEDAFAEINTRANANAEYQIYLTPVDDNGAINIQKSGKYTTLAIPAKARSIDIIGNGAGVNSLIYSGNLTVGCTQLTFININLVPVKADANGTPAAGTINVGKNTLRLIDCTDSYNGQAPLITGITGDKSKANLFVQSDNLIDVTDMDHVFGVKGNVANFMDVFVDGRFYVTGNLTGIKDLSIAMRPVDFVTDSAGGDYTALEIYSSEIRVDGNVTGITNLFFGHGGWHTVMDVSYYKYVDGAHEKPVDYENGIGNDRDNLFRHNVLSVGGTTTITNIELLEFGSLIYNKDKVPTVTKVERYNSPDGVDPDAELLLMQRGYSLTRNRLGGYSDIKSMIAKNSKVLTFKNGTADLINVSAEYDSPMANSYYSYTDYQPYADGNAIFVKWNTVGSE